MITRQTRPLLIAALALAAAGLACALGAPSADPTPSGSLATVTPGGRVSVSLLTPTLSVGGAPDLQATVIGPVATATAAARIEADLTATGAFPTPTIPGIFSEPARCPALASPALPAQPPAFNRYAETMVRFLSEGGAPTVLEAQLRSWGALTPYGGLVRADRDFTGDGVPEVLVVALDPQNAEFPYPGDLLVFGCEDGAYRLLYQAGYARNRSAPIIYSADDINGNYLNNLVYAVQTCEREVCYTSLEIVEWSLALANFSSLIGDSISEPLAEVIIREGEDGSAREIVIRRGTIASPAAGPQRVYTTTLRWDGAQYAVASIVPDPAVYRIHVLQDADAALLARDYSGAITLYRQAITDESLRSWQYPDEALILQAYARFRLVLAYAARGDVSSAQTVHDQLTSLYAPPEPAEGEPPPPVPLALPGSGFADMARLFWRDFAINRSLASACQIVTGYARAAPASYEVLNSFGYTNPTVTATDLCPFP